MASRIIQVNAKVLEEIHLKLRGLLVTQKLPHKNFTEWLQAKEKETVETYHADNVQ